MNRINTLALSLALSCVLASATTALGGTLSTGSDGTSPLPTPTPVATPEPPGSDATSVNADLTQPGTLDLIYESGLFVVRGFLSVI